MRDSDHSKYFVILQCKRIVERIRKKSVIKGEDYNIEIVKLLTG